MLSSVLAVVIGLGETLCAKAPVVQRLTAYSGCGTSCRLSRGVPAERAPITWGLIDTAIAANARMVERSVKLVSGSVKLAHMDECTPNTGLVVSSTCRLSSGKIDFIAAPPGLSARDVRDTAVRHELERQRGQELVRARRTGRHLIGQGAAASGSECRPRSACHHRMGCPPGGFRQVPQAGRRARAARLRPGGRLRRRRRAPAPAARRP